MNKLRFIFLSWVLLFLALAVQAKDQPPTVIKAYQPLYPFEHYKNRVPGKVLVQFMIEVDGRVSEIKVLEGTDKDFEIAAIQCISKWTFRPGMKDGKPQRTPAEMPFVFDSEKKR